MDPFHDFLLKVENAILIPLIELISLAAFLLFLVGVAQFVMGASDEEVRKKGKNNMVWGLVGLTIIFGANAIIALMKATVGAS